MNAIGAMPPGGSILRTPITPSPRGFHTGGVPAIATTSGTDSTPVLTEMYLAELAAPLRTLATGIALFCGSVDTGNIFAALYDANGVLLDITGAIAGAVTTGYQRLPFLNGVMDLQPGSYYVAVMFSSTAFRFRSHTVGNMGAGKLTGQTNGVFPASLQGLLPSTFTTVLGPLAGLY